MVIVRVIFFLKKVCFSVDEGLKFFSLIYLVIIFYIMIVGQIILYLRVEKSEGLINFFIWYRVQFVDLFNCSFFFSFNFIKGFFKIDRDLIDFIFGEKLVNFVFQVIVRV